MSINVTKSSMPSFEEYCREIAPLWDTHWLTNMGVKHKELESQLETYLGVPHLTLYTNGHLALEGIIAAMQFKSGSEVITTPFTFASTTHAIVRNGLVPVFCDIDPVDYTIDADRIEQLITEKTVAIVPVHVYGNVCNVEKIAAIARKHKLKVIYDAAHAFGVQIGTVGIGNFGDASMFSFHATKVFNTIEGGAVTYSDENLVGILNDLKNFGIRGPESVVYVGGNAKMNEFQAAMGICNLRHVDECIRKRKTASAHYDSRLSGVEGIRVKKSQENVKSNYAYYPVVFDGFKKTRDEVFSLLMNHEIVSRKYFFPLTNSFECYRDYPTAGPEKTPIAVHVANNVLTLPMYADIETDNIDRICDLILS